MRKARWRLRLHTENTIDIRGNIDQIFSIASAVEEWPRLLPHYRWVKILSGTAHERVVEMAAHRDGFPVWWVARQWLEPAKYQMHFTHVRGISRGMEVTWFLEGNGPVVHVNIVHTLTLPWPLIGRFMADVVIGRLFVSNIANKTLRTIKVHIEHHGHRALC